LPNLRQELRSQQKHVSLKAALYSRRNSATPVNSTSFSFNPQFDFVEHKTTSSQVPLVHFSSNNIFLFFSPNFGFFKEI
jgi:hypothetical protein